MEIQAAAAALGGEKALAGDEDQRILLDTGGDDGDSSKIFDLLPHTTADMFHPEKFLLSLLCLQSPYHHFSHAESSN